MDRYLGIDSKHVIGSGSYGVVYKVQDRFTNEILALKKIVDEPRPVGDKGRMGVPFYVVREVSILRELRHENIVLLRDCVFDDLSGSLSLVFEFMETDLHQYIQDHDEILDPGTVRSLLYQCLNGIACCHESGVIHRDLKPANLLVSKSGQLKVADFGLARACGPSLRRLTHEVVTLWYRAPEILLGSRLYGFAADMWSVGLIFVEMITKTPLFRTKHLVQIEVLFKIFQQLGTPSEASWPRVTLLPDWNSDFPRWRKSQFDPMIRSQLQANGMDLLTRMLTLDPSKRIAAKAALLHSYF